jgi:biopolymer transport protein ExbB/TolQ
MFHIIDEMDRMSPRHADPAPIQGRVLRRWIDELRSEWERMTAEIETLKSKKAKAA